ncbi:MAG TPA: type I restriction endonuclease subunit R [Elusimicrobiota bacterium]|nr:type I restriction endonuclease subunit R [Elusimicrobiota bacterium]
MIQPTTIDYSENALVEKPAIELLHKLGWKPADCFHEFDSGPSPLGRETPAEVVLIQRLKVALKKLNPKLPDDAIKLAIEEIVRDRSKMSMAAANREVYALLKHGVRNVSFKNDKGEDVTETVKVIDWESPTENDFFLASQFWIAGEMYKRRTDLLGFVNGIPLLFIELKASHKDLKKAFDDNLRDYKNSIPHLFWHNGLIILSNGSESKIGTVTAQWEHFSDWKKINNEGEKGIVSLETMLRGVCDPPKLLDMLENFTLFSEVSGGCIKLGAKNHQYLGVNNVMTTLEKIKKNQGRLGVFWHTQGSGKSISMIFFAQKVLRKIPGNWTFVIVTDRQELDDQIYKNFANAGVVTEQQAQANSGKELQQLLQEDHRYIFTLIQKFRTEKGQKYPMISDRSDIIVIADEAHRSQYDVFALNMRSALPNAAFIGFTGTPLMEGEEKTKDVFGSYVSVYNFKQSVDDKATVPLFYENRIPELQLTNAALNEDMQKLIEAAELDEEQEKKLEREFQKEYHLITRNDRLEKIAKDLVDHFMGRGHMGKAMVVAIDKATAVKMYDKVQKCWKAYLDDLIKKAKTAKDTEKELIENKIIFMKETDMAVVVSQSQNEIEDLRKRGVEIKPHRLRMVKEDLDKKFKDADDPFRIVFVCAMWMTGFDVPSCSTIYLDKPMQNHTLMQTIARANRVFPEKENGLIVDYIGVFRNLQKALSIYAPTPGDGVDMPIMQKAELIKLLRMAIKEAAKFCNEKKIDLGAIIVSKGFEKVKLIDDAVEAILVNDQSKKKYLTLADNTTRLFRAIKPDPLANEFIPMCTLFAVLAEKIRVKTGGVADISGIMAEVEKLLDRSVAAEGYIIKPEVPLDLTKIDFEVLKKQFAKGRKRMEVEKLRGALHSMLLRMVRHNRTRMNFLQHFQKMIDDYNAGSVNVQEFFKQLIEFAQKLKEEEKRGIRGGLSEEELAVFDLLTKPEIKLSKKDESAVKKVAKDLLETLKKEKLVLDWRKRQQTRAAVRLCIETTLEGLPEIYSKELYQQKCEVAYQHVYEAYFGSGGSIYNVAA